MSQIEFKAPGPGSWELEQTHFGKPATRHMSAVEWLPAKARANARAVDTVTLARRHHIKATRTTSQFAI